MTREQIVSQALQLLGTEGIEALSMRKLAARLEAGATSLYWHVANRDELIELVIDEIYGELEVPDADADDAGDWRAVTRRFAHSMRSTTLRHRWVVSVLDRLVAAYLGPNLTGATERMLALFEAAGFELPEAERALNTVSAYVTGVAMGESRVAQLAGPSRSDPAGVDGRRHARRRGGHGACSTGSTPGREQAAFGEETPPSPGRRRSR